MSESIILAIETSQREGGVAVSTAAGEVLTETLQSGPRQDDTLMPAIDRIMARARLRPGALDAVAVSIGPGGFTGLRIAVSTVKLMAEALGVAVIGVPSALVAAASSGERERVMVLLASKRHSVWATLCAPDPAAGSWRMAEPAGLVTAEKIDLHGATVVLADRYLPEPIRALCTTRSVPVHDPRFDPRACLQLGRTALARAEAVDPLALVPIYAREPEAVALWDRRKADGSRASGVVR